MHSKQRRALWRQSGSIGELAQRLLETARTHEAETPGPATTPDTDAPQNRRVDVPQLRMFLGRGQ